MYCYGNYFRRYLKVLFHTHSLHRQPELGNCKVIISMVIIMFSTINKMFGAKSLNVNTTTSLPNSHPNSSLGDPQDKKSLQILHHLKNQGWRDEFSFCFCFCWVTAWPIWPAGIRVRSVDVCTACVNNPMVHAEAVNEEALIKLLTRKCWFLLHVPTFYTRCIQTVWKIY